VGDHCRIGANALVFEDMPPPSVAVPQPTRVPRRENLDNRQFSHEAGGGRMLDRRALDSGL